MNIKQFSVNQPSSWEYLPDTNTLLGYLDRRDLIELSKCCKSYRNQLERQVLKILDLTNWVYNNGNNYIKFNGSNNTREVLGFLKTELGSKLKYVKKIILNPDLSRGFAKAFVKLLPNIKTLTIYGGEIDECGCCYTNSRLSKGLKYILKCMEHLEHVHIFNIVGSYRKYNAKNQIFPKSIKSLKIDIIYREVYYFDDLYYYEKIDISYTNLYSLTIISDRVLQNLSHGMQNLQEVEIDNLFISDTSNVVAFLKANPQLRKLNIKYSCDNVEVIKTVLSSKYLEHWRVGEWNLMGIEVNELPFNYSIKYFGTNTYKATGTVLKIVNACKRLETLDLENYDINLYPDW